MKRFLFVLMAVLAASVCSFAQNDTLKVLAIGNSFSDDAIEEHLHGLAKAEGLTIVIGNIYKAGCSIERHVKYLRGDVADYEFRKIDAEGVRTIEYRYGKDQMQMYNAIISTVNEVIPQIKDIKILIPSGTAVQNARTSILGDDLTRDGYHLSRPVGRYVASCTWLQAVLGKNPVGNTYCPEGMTPQQCKAAQKAARKAVRKPSKISRIK